MAVDVGSHCPYVLRWANGLHDEKPLSVPRDARFQLETCPLTAVDALGNTQPGPQSPPSCWGAWSRRLRLLSLQSCGSFWNTSGSSTSLCTLSVCTSSQRPTILCWAQSRRPTSLCSGACSLWPSLCILPLAVSTLGGGGGRRHGTTSLSLSLTCCLWDHPLCHKLS